VLVRSIEEVETPRLEDYYQPFQLANLIQNQKTYIENLDKRIVRWKYIEVMSPKEVEEIFEFVFPNYEFQYLYINNSRTEPLMIERL